MGCCATKLPDEVSFASTDIEPSEWSQAQIAMWLQLSCNGELRELVPVFQYQQISGVSFVKLTSDHLKEFGVKQIGLRDKFVFERDKVLSNYQQNMHKKKHHKKLSLKNAFSSNKSNRIEHQMCINLDLDSGSDNNKNHRSSDLQPRQSFHAAVHSSTLTSSHTPNSPKQSQFSHPVSDREHDDDNAHGLPFQYRFHDKLDEEKSMDDNHTPITAVTGTHSFENIDTLKLSTFIAPPSGSAESHESIISAPSIRASLMVHGTATMRTTMFNAYTPSISPRDYTSAYISTTARKATDFMNNQSTTPTTATLPYHRPVGSPSSPLAVSDISQLPQLPYSTVSNPAGKTSKLAEKWTKLTDMEAQMEYIRCRLFESSEQRDYLQTEQQEYLRWFESSHYNHFYELHAYEPFVYVHYSRMVTDGFLRRCDCTHSDVRKLCYLYYYQHDIHLLQVTYDIFLILDEFAHKEQDCCFTGEELLSAMHEKYSRKYVQNRVHSASTSTDDRPQAESDRDIAYYLADVMKHGNVELIAKSKAIVHGGGNFVDLNALHDDEELNRKLSHRQHSVLNESYLFMINAQIYSIFEKHRYFIQHKLDRASWSKGTNVEIWSSSLGGWQIGEIESVSDEQQFVTVLYGTENNKFRKKLHRGQEDVLRSTREYIDTRNAWDVGMKLEIFSYSQNKWLIGTITDKLRYFPEIEHIEDQKQDVLGIVYSNQVDDFKKYMERWNPDIRALNILPAELRRYEPGNAIKVYSNTKQCWFVGKIKRLEVAQQQLVVVYGEKLKWEKRLQLDSKQIQLLDQ